MLDNDQSRNCVLWFTEDMSYSISHRRLSESGEVKGKGKN
jgi:hypothetical protein